MAYWGCTLEEQGCAVTDLPCYNEGEVADESDEEGSTTPAPETTSTPATESETEDSSEDSNGSNTHRSVVPVVRLAVTGLIVAAAAHGSWVV